MVSDPFVLLVAMSWACVRCVSVLCLWLVDDRRRAFRAEAPDMREIREGHSRQRLSQDLKGPWDPAERGGERTRVRNKIVGKPHKCKHWFTRQGYPWEHLTGTEVGDYRW